MNLVIYNINSFGGSYDYSKCIFEAYSNHACLRSCMMLMPVNAETEGANILKILHGDVPLSSNKLYRKAHFLYRSFVNPFRLYAYLKKQPPCVVLFNDFDQTTAPFWVPFFRKLRNRHRFAVLLHDPDRDNYFSVKWLSRYTMNSITSFMDVAFYHGYLPERTYYKRGFLKVKVPHGIYGNTATDEDFFLHLKTLAEGNKIIGILGNIRPEKNYESAIDALRQLPGTKLLIAGNLATSSVSLNHYKEYAIKAGVQDKIIWIVDYLSWPRFNAAIKACDVVVMYYKSSFTSQSGILNAIAPFRKKMVISDTESSLKESVATYGLGKIVPHENVHKLVEAIRELFLSGSDSFFRNWENYIQASSWDTHVSIAVQQYKKIMREF